MITLLTGPGTHSHFLTEALREEGYLDKVVSYFPEWEVRNAQGQRIDWVRSYRWLTRALWAAWRRIPLIGGSEHPRAWHFALYDWLVSQRVALSPILWAWWGTSLYTMRKARREGRTILLEAPACHPRTWNAIAKPLYAEHFPGAKHTFAILPENYVARLEAELQEAHHIQVLSTFAKQTFIEHGVPAEKLYILPLGVDVRVFYPEAEAQITTEKFIVLYIGRIDPLKGVQYLMEAFGRLQLPHAELWMVGPVVEEMKPLLAKYLGENVKYFGARTHSELRLFYNKSSVVVFPTLLDSFGMVILEAMACGKPVIATAHSGAPDVMNENMGFVISAFSSEAIAEALERSYLRRDYLFEMGRAAYQHVLSHYTLEAYRHRVAKYLHFLIKSYGLAQT